MQLLDLTEQQLPLADLVLVLRERRRPLLARLDVLGEPAIARFIAREGGDEFLAGHLCVTHRNDHNLLLELTNFVDVSTQIVDQRFEHARRELQFHELGRKLAADLLRLRVFDADLGDRGNQLRVQFLQRGEPSGGLHRIRPRIHGLFAVFSALGLFVLCRRSRSLDFGRILRLRDHIGRIGIDEADDDVRQASAARRLHRLVGLEDEIIGRRVQRDLLANVVEAFLDALGDADFALAGEQFDGAHLAHVHAHRIGGAPEFGIERSECRRGLFDGLFVGGGRGFGREQRVALRRLFVHRDAHVVDRVDDLFDLLGVDDLRGQVVVHLRVGEVALLLAKRDQLLQLRLALLG